LITTKRIAIDGGGVNDPEETVTFVEDLISRAQELAKKIN
jgi:hypothetical protein